MKMPGSFLSGGKTFSGSFEFTKGNSLGLCTDLVLNVEQKVVVNVTLPKLGMICVAAQVKSVQKKEGRVYHDLQIIHSDFPTQRKFKKALLGSLDYLVVAA